MSIQRSTATPYRPATHIPTEIGDVLILRTTNSYTTHAVGLVSEHGQQDFREHTTLAHLSDFRVAVDRAKALVATGGRIFVRNLDTGAWSEIPH